MEFLKILLGMSYVTEEAEAEVNHRTEGKYSNKKLVPQTARVN
jgi:hypothetical protein